MPKGIHTKRVITSCLQCEVEISTTENKISRGMGKYCSKVCYDIAQTKEVLSNCTQCNEELYITLRQSRNKTGTYFCDTECYKEYRRNLEDNRPTNECKMCNDEYRVDNYKQDGSCFCSRKCQAKYSSLYKTGENSPVFIERILLNCDWCNEEYKEEKYIVEVVNSKKHFCGRKCSEQYHRNVTVKDPVFLESRRIKMIEMLNDGTINTTETKPQIIINELLIKLKIKFENEYSINYYSIDNFLTDHNLFIEVMGGYWHVDNRFFKEVCQEPQVKRVRMDKAKKSYSINNYGKNILYLWEYDINENLELCELLINEFILNNGILENYHSFNYSIVKDKLCKAHDLTIPYMDMSAELFNTFINFEVKERMCKVDPLKHTTFNCDQCNEESSQLTIRYDTSEKHFCGNDCLAKYFNHGLRFIYNCGECSKEIEVKKHIHEQFLKNERENIFCDMNCKGLWQSKNVVGVNNKNFTSVEKLCEFCSSPYLVTNSRKEISRYCSPKCSQSAERERFIVNCSNCNSPKEVVKSKLKQENHFCSVACGHLFRSKQGRENRNCETCNEEFNCKKSETKRFCSIKCQSVWQSTTLVGEKSNSYNWNKNKIEKQQLQEV